MKKISSSLLLLSLTLFSFPVIAKEPVNLNVYKEQLIQYHDSGQYERDIEQVIKEADTYLKSELSRPAPKGKKRAIVLDIDETSISSYASMLNLKFGGNPKLWDEAESKAEAPAIPPTLKLYQFAKANGVAVIFITGRHEGKNKRETTAKNLEKAGFNHWDKLILKPLAYNHKPAGLYKSAMRKQLTEEGYDIVLNVGDQESDLVGNYAHKSFKLPNPYYFIP